jgi:endo-1,4-beta-xylanase
VAPAAPVAPFSPKAGPDASLRESYKGIFHMGVAITPGQISGQNPQAMALILKQFDCTSPENILKMALVHPRPGNDLSSYDFAAPDQYVDFGVQNHLWVIGHNLCWHSQMPGWMSQPDADGAPLTKEIMMGRLHDHIMTVVGRYKGRINGWDVVNEVVADTAGDRAPGATWEFPGGMRNSPWYQYCGLDYIEMAFKWAHEADPKAELYYNDYNLDLENKADNKRQTALALVKYLQSKGAPITGVGLQCHYNLTAPGTAALDQTIQLFADLNVKLMVTEFDVTVNRGNNVTGAVGANVGGPGARAGAQGARGAAPGAPLPAPTALPTLATLTTQLTLTDAQAAQIGPIVAQVDKALADFGTASTSFQTARTDAGTKIAGILTDAQKPLLATYLNPGANRGARGARAGNRGGAAATPVLTDQQQYDLAKRYAEIFAVLIKHRDVVTRVTFWGLSDPESWRAAQSPLLFGANYVEKPAFDSVIDAVRVAGLAK